jgi:hypothetical protein
MDLLLTRQPNRASLIYLVVALEILADGGPVDGHPVELLVSQGLAPAGGDTNFSEGKLGLEPVIDLFNRIDIGRHQFQSPSNG